MAGQPPPPYPFSQDPDRTVAYRRPAPGGAEATGPAAGHYAYGAPPQAGPPYGGQPGGTARMPAAMPAPGWDRVELGPPVPPAGRGRHGRSGRSRGWLVAIIAAVVVALVGGGGVYAMSLLSGGGTQPEDVLPAGTMAYVRLDLDPSAGQKLALFQLARKFSATRGAFTGEDPRKALFELLRQGDSGLAKVDYARDVAPWLGDRIGVGVLAPKSPDTTPRPVVAVQVTDQDQARAGLRKLDRERDLKGLAFREDYAILAETQQEADAYAAGAPLSGEAAFAEDRAALGEPGVLSFWGDAGAIAKAARAAGATAEDGTVAMVENMRFAGALRFDSGYAELTGFTRGGQVRAAAGGEGARLSRLPASTVGALSVSSLGELVTEQWPRITEAADAAGGSPSFSDIVAQARQSYGISLPEDLTTLLGRNLTVAVDEAGLDGQIPNVGAVLATDPAKAQQVLDKIEKAVAGSGTGTPQVFRVPGDGRLVVASSQEYADRLAADGTLGESETFTTAIPDADTATAAFYLDLDKLEKYYLSGLGEEGQANARPLRAVGASARRTGDLTSFSLRVLFN
ncbi:hypothetical protein Sme01_39630 [Sphaerisporangium melleum]|uniref:DUF3352 domain-containing protein n=1 Tax=Sphaerisporangium melleum TaxID=321316 RepID=A0A917VJA7_9ACTN|nr:DUF3352 domain-containing protein [Sphaerisporangium melleum]GGK86235.1 hypothetical protein GCM10007964_31050 [Sphaerisporangium melleum]GII71487.1 hypothetical protein Sme01_39630 [Sphaerisporangium melleum]